MAKKGNRVQVILECTEHKNSGLEVKKFNPVLRKVTVHKEIK